MPLKRSIELGRPFGIPLGVHGSWFPAAALLVAHFFFTVFSGESAPAAVGLGVIATLAFFACLVAHELGHALVARSLGIPVVDITLFIFGGVARIAREPSRPAQEFVIALAGPVVSGALAAGLFVLAGVLTGPVGMLVWTIAAANLVLAIFNLLPGFPLDGGRLLRALLWARSGDRYRAALAAGRGGQAIGAALVAGGLVVFLSRGGDVPATGTAEGLWLAVVGAFLYILATGSRRASRVGAALEREAAGGWARPFAGTIAPDAPLAGVVTGGSVPYAVAHDGRLAGILLPHAGRLELGSGTARDLMVPWSPTLALRADEPLTRALERLAAHPPGVLVVVDGEGGVIGVLDRDGVRSRLRTKVR